MYLVPYTPKMSNEEAEQRLARLQSLLEDYPELRAGLDELAVDEADDGAVALVGAFTLIQLRLRSVLNLLPGPNSDD